MDCFIEKYLRETVYKNRIIDLMQEREHMVKLFVEHGLIKYVGLVHRVFDSKIQELMI